MTSDITKFTAEADDAGSRIDKWLHLRMPELSRSRIQGLIGEGTVPRKMLQCPSAGGNRRCDYFYLPPSADPAEDPAGLPRYLLAACDLRGNHRNVRNVMYAAGNVRKLSEAAFQAELAKPINAAFAAALKKAEGP